MSVDDWIDYQKSAYDEYVNFENQYQQANKATAITDCKSMFDVATKNTIPACEEYRTTLECLIIRERLLNNMQMRWVHTGAMIADCLMLGPD